jgi:apolipoprotein N-acyltransferase
LRGAAAASATALSAVLFGLAFPPWEWKPLAFVALAPLLLAVRAGSARRAAALAVGWSLLAAWVIGDWMPQAVAVYFEQPRPVGYLFFAGVVAAMAAPYYAFAALAYRALAPRAPVAAAPLVAAAAWVTAELGRGRLMTGTPFLIGNPWGLLGYSQVGADALVQVASLGGVYAVSFAVAAANAGLAELVARRAQLSLRGAALALAAALAPAALSVAWGAAALRAASLPPDAAGTPVALVQGDVDLGRGWRSEYYGENLDAYLELTRRAAGAAPRIAVWPESALTFLLAEEPGFARAIARELAGLDLELLAGGPQRIGNGSDRFYNSYYRLTPTGAIAGRYDKQLLVPFSEYVPPGAPDLIRRRFDGARLFAPAASGGLLETRAGPAGVVLCNEAMLPELVAERVRAGASWLVNPSNDTWIRASKFTEHLFDVVALRAVEQRRFLVRASTSGPTAIVDPWGRVAARAPSFEPATLAGVVHPRSDLTPYARVGDAFAVGCALLVAGAAAAAWRRPVP